MKNFITEIIDSDIKENVHEKRVHTRFPPEPNGYLHIGHAKSIHINFGIANDYSNGKCNLRFDDTNPSTEEIEYVDSIIQDVQWLGFKIEKKLFFASDYFQQMYDYAIKLIKLGKAYVDDQSIEEIKNNRGTLKMAGIESKYRNRTIEDNINLFQLMKSGKFKNGEKVLRAKIDMAHPNLNMRDPIMYRILHVPHHRTGTEWCIYPMYDWAHGLEDSIEEITHSICTLEFEDHRILYDWFLNKLNIYHPKQIEFARLNLNYTIMSKRKLKVLVENNHVSGWDDPRMPTISGLRRRGYTPEAIKEFATIIGVAKRDGIIDIALLESCVREHLNRVALRVMAVLDPVKLIITNYPNNKVETLDADNNPENTSEGQRKLSFSNTLFIERSDFMEEPSKKFFRLAPGQEVRLKHAYYIKCHHYIKDDKGSITEIHCTYDPNTRGGWIKNGRKVKGTLHWVSAQHAVDAEIRLYGHLFNKEQPDSKNDFISNLNPKSLQVIKNAKLEPSLKHAKNAVAYQFLRNGYFCIDSESTSKRLIFNRTVSLRDSWIKKNT